MKKFYWVFFKNYGDDDIDYESFITKDEMFDWLRETFTLEYGSEGIRILYMSQEPETIDDLKVNEKKIADVVF